MEVGHRLGPSHRIEAPQLIGEPRRVSVEGRRMTLQQIGQPLPDMGHGEHGLVGHLVQTDPQPEVVALERRQASRLGPGQPVQEVEIMAPVHGGQI